MQMRLIIFCEEIRIAVAFIQDRSNKKMWDSLVEKPFSG